MLGDTVMPVPPVGPQPTRARERGRHSEILCATPRLYALSWLPPSTAHRSAKCKPDKPVTTQGRGRLSGRRDAGRGVDESKREGVNEVVVLLGQQSKRSNEAKLAPRS